LIAYPDTSFLCALYRMQDNSERALAWREAMLEPLHVSRPLLWEFRQSARFQAFRHRRDRDVGYPMHEAEKMIADLGEDMKAGLVVAADCDLADVFVIGERLSNQWTYESGHRSFDILHIATALALGARDFLSFDANQIQLAAAEGLATPLQWL